jgi:hypothetical protein
VHDFRDSIARVAEAFAADRAQLEAAGSDVSIEVQQPGHIRALTTRADEQTRIEWAHDSARRLLPVLPSPAVGFVLRSIDLALDKVLALAGRDEPRSTTRSGSWPVSRRRSRAVSIGIPQAKGFVAPDAMRGDHIVPHYGRPWWGLAAACASGVAERGATPSVVLVPW